MFCEEVKVGKSLVLGSIRWFWHLGVRVAVATENIEATLDVNAVDDQSIANISFKDPDWADQHIPALEQPNVKIIYVVATQTMMQINQSE